MVAPAGEALGGVVGVFQHMVQTGIDFGSLFLVFVDQEVIAFVSFRQNYAS